MDGMRPIAPPLACYKSTHLACRWLTGSGAEAITHREGILGENIANLARLHSENEKKGSPDAVRLFK